jgi:hypothetical protein
MTPIVNSASDSSSPASPVASSKGGSVRAWSARVSIVAFLLIATLFGAALAGVGMANMGGNATPRLNPLTLGLALVPVWALASIAFLWSQPAPSSQFSPGFRVLATLVLLLISGYCVFTARFLSFFAG